MVLGLASNAKELDGNVRSQQGFKDIVSSAERFAADFSGFAYADYDGDENVVFSPISVYMALALTSECAGGQTREELLNALGVTRDLLHSDFANLYNALSAEHKRGKSTVGKVVLSNSIWVNKGTKTNKDCINSLANNFYCNSFSTDFAKDNRNANKAVRKFIKDNTNGLIDKDFELSEQTEFALINSLYLKDIWNYLGKDLTFTSRNYDFTDKNGNVKALKLLMGEYNSGRVVETDTYSTFYTTTYAGYKIKFILPKDGYTVDEVFTAQNIAFVNSIVDYNYMGNRYTRYETRCLFPEFSANYDRDVKNILQSKFGVTNLFDENSCDLSSLSSSNIYCNEVKHVATLTVNKKGIEGTAATIFDMIVTGAPPVWLDFVIDKAFGFILTDSHDCTLFTGVVNKV